MVSLGGMNVTVYYYLKITNSNIFNRLLEKIVPEQSIFHIIRSVLAAFIGVQSDKNRQADFEQGSLKNFIIAGLIFTVIFVLTIIYVVSKVTG
jgi:hypothetical protein